MLDMILSTYVCIVRENFYWNHKITTRLLFGLLHENSSDFVHFTRASCEHLFDSKNAVSKEIW